MKRTADEAWGQPDISPLSNMTKRDISICEAMLLWIGTVRKVPEYGPAWLPSDMDIRKSRLFWRIRSGKPPLDYPPPRAFSCPWYEVVEEPQHRHRCMDVGPDPEDKTRIIANQCVYAIEQTLGEQDWMVSFGPYRFRLWHDDRAKEDWWDWFMQRQPETETSMDPVRGKPG